MTLDLAVNVSGRQLLTPGFVGMVATTLAAAGTAAVMLILEVTESVLMDDVGLAQLVLKELRETGVRIALDAAVTNPAHVLSLPVTAEGIETRQQGDQVRAIGCEYSQGFYFARPMTSAAIEELLGAPDGGTGHLPSARRSQAV